jgi:aerobic-type carbon monoxide dehydrogenase small subunit (CoxS/CutS family)
MAKSIELEVNGKRHAVNYPPDTPLLSVLRDELGLTGSKYGCGEGQCGACTVLIGGAPRRSCMIPVTAAAGKPILTCIPCSRRFSMLAHSNALTAPRE